MKDINEVSMEKKIKIEKKNTGEIIDNLSEIEMREVVKYCSPCLDGFFCVNYNTIMGTGEIYVKAKNENEALKVAYEESSYLTGYEAKCIKVVPVLKLEWRVANELLENGIKINDVCIINYTPEGTVQVSNGEKSIETDIDITNINQLN